MSKEKPIRRSLGFREANQMAVEKRIVATKDDAP
jgi:hypothetical protein